MKTGISDLREWDQAVAHLASRAEELPNATQAFAETDFLERIKARQNQAIFGRRGTGKTHLLRRLQEECLTNFAESRTVPILVNGSQLRNQAVKLVEDPAVVALALYVEFMNALVAQIHDFLTEQLDPGLIDSLFGGPKSQQARRAQDLASRLRDLVRSGEVRFLPTGEASDEAHTLIETASKLSGGLKLDVSDPKSLGWSVNLGAAASKEKKHSDVRLRTVKGEVILPFSEVSSQIRDLLQVLEGASLIVLFDEWSDVAKTLEPQPYLADMIKRTLSSIREMQVKLACIPGRTRLATPVSSTNPIPVGYELGDDIKGVDLDSAVFVQNEVADFVAFFLVVLQRHTGMTLERVKSMPPKRFHQFLATRVFEGPEVFSELCQASAGVPRDLLALLQEATSLRGNPESGKVTMLHVRRAAQRLYGNKKESFAQGSPELLLLERIYREIIAKHRTYLFLLSEDRLEDPRVLHLWMERLIHRLPATHYDFKTHASYVYYQMDYGKTVDLMRSEAQRAGEQAATQTLTSIVPDFESRSLFGIKLADVARLFGHAAAAVVLAKQPAGNVAPDPTEIIVVETFFTE